MKRILLAFSFFSLICLISLAWPSDANAQQDQRRIIVKLPHSQYDNEDIVSEMGAAFTAEEIRRGNALTKLSTFDYKGRRLTTGIDWSGSTHLVYIDGIPYQYKPNLLRYNESEVIRSWDESVWYFYEDLYRGDTMSVIVGVVLSLIPLVLLVTIFYFSFRFYNRKNVQGIDYSFSEVPEDEEPVVEADYEITIA